MGIRRGHKKKKNKIFVDILWWKRETIKRENYKLTGKITFPPYKVSKWSINNQQHRCSVLRTKSKNTKSVLFHSKKFFQKTILNCKSQYHLKNVLIDFFYNSNRESFLIIRDSDDEIRIRKTISIKILTKLLVLKVLDYHIESTSQLITLNTQLG